MNRFKTMLAATALGATALAGSVHAQTAATTTQMVQAEVRKVDKENKKITLKHGEIKNLEMPPMTMVFGVKDAAVLDKVQAGDKVQFRAIKDGGTFTVTEIQPSK